MARPMRHRPTLVGTFENGTAEWHAERALRIGGSEVASILGVSPFQSHYQLWMRKAGHAPDEPDSPRFRAGHYLEPSIIAWLRDETGLEIRTRAAMWHHPERPWQAANVDGLAYPTRTSRTPIAVVEAKTEAQPWKWGADGSDEVPIYYACQGLWYCDVMGLDRCIFGMLDDSFRFHQYELAYDADLAAVLRERAVEFIGSLDDEAPPIDASDRTYEMVKAMHPLIEERTVELPADLAREYACAKVAESKAEKAAKAARNRIAEAMGSAQYATYDGLTVARREARGEGTPYVTSGQTGKVAALFPDEYRSDPDQTEETP